MAITHDMLGAVKRVVVWAVGGETVRSKLVGARGAGAPDFMVIQR
jgi:hypothetical protein